MTNFFERQEQARRRTVVLVLYFVLAVVLIAAAIYLLVAFLFFRPAGGVQGGWDWLWQPLPILYTLGGTTGLIVIGSLIKTAQVWGPGTAVAEMLGARPLDLQSADPAERKLLNVVEEMAIASGTPMPAVYLMEDQSINAFAAGTAPENAAVGVTRGCMELLSREELQGVMAHEFSHILNGDMRLNIRLMGLLFGIMSIAVVGRVVLQGLYFGGGTRRRSRRDGEGGGGVLAIVALGLGLLIIGYIGLFFGRLIKSAVSRQREYLADASAVQFTRNPGGIAGALKKIGGLSYGSRVSSPNAEEASHLFFGNGLKASWAGALATHPPLEERIRRLDPSFKGEYPEVKPPKREQVMAHRGRMGAGRRPVQVPAISGLSGGGVEMLQMAPAEVAEMVGMIQPEHLQYAQVWRENLPEELEEAVHEPFGATALMYAMVWSEDEAVRDKQRDVLREHGRPGILDETERLRPWLEALDAAAYLPLLDLGMPALRQLSSEQYVQFRQNLERLIGADEELDLFEFMLQKAVVRHLRPHFEREKGTGPQYYSMNGLLEEIECLLSALAQVGHFEEEGRQRAFLAGVSQLRIRSGRMRLRPMRECHLGHIGDALEKLGQANPAIKRRTMQACIYAVAADGRVHPREAELLRAIGDALDCPLPPFLGQAKKA